MTLHVFFEKWWSTVADQGLLTGWWHVFLEHVGRDEADTLGPVFFFLRFYVNCKEQLEFLRMILFKLFKFFFEQYITYSPISKHQGDIGRVVIQQYSLNDLVARRDAGASSDAADLRFASHFHLRYGEVTKPFILQSPFRPLHLHRVTYLQLVNVLTHHSALWELGMDVGPVYLDEEVDEAAVCQGTDRSVLPLNLLTLRLLLRFDSGREDNMLAYWKAK